MKTYTIRPNTYRGRQGFTVGSRGGNGYPIRIFVETRDAAEHVRGMLRRDADIELVDFAGHDRGLFDYCTRCMGKVAA